MDLSNNIMDNKVLMENVDDLDILKNLGLTLKVDIDYHTTNENKFSVSMFKTLLDNGIKHFTIIPTANKYDNTDFIVTNTLTNNKMYIELKCRDVKFENYESFFINANKIKLIKQKKLVPCILVWRFGNVGNKVYYIIYDDDFVNKYNVNSVWTITGNANSNVMSIMKKDMTTGFDNLCNRIINILSLE
jgi:hypothetical protein